MRHYNITIVYGIEQNINNIQDLGPTSKKVRRRTTHYKITIANGKEQNMNNILDLGPDHSFISIL